MTQPWKPFCPENFNKIYEEMKRAYAEGKPANYLPDKYRDNAEALLILVKMNEAMVGAANERLYEVLKNEMPREEVFRESIKSIQATMQERVENSEDGHECEKSGLRSSALGIANLLDRLSVDPGAVCNPELLEEANLVSARLRRMVNDV